MGNLLKRIAFGLSSVWLQRARVEEEVNQFFALNERRLPRAQTVAQQIVEEGGRSDGSDGSGDHLNLFSRLLFAAASQTLSKRACADVALCRI